MRVKKLPMGVTDEFVAEMNSMDIPDIKSHIVTMQHGLDEARSFLKENEEICDLKDQLKLSGGPTRDTIKVLKNRTKYALERLKERGAI